MSASETTNPDPPLGLLAELTHRCPLACPYCSNPVALEDRAAELDTPSWARVFREAAELGVLQVHLSGGEPASRRDVVDIAAAAHDAGLYTNLITSGIGLDAARLERLRTIGLDHVQISIQDANPESADRIADYAGAHARKLSLARTVVGIGLPLTINVVVHRANIARLAELVALAVELGAARVEIAHTQYYGWALRNRAALMPTRAQVAQAMAELGQIREKYRDQLIIDAVVPDYYARRPKPCMGGWGRRSLNVTPSGRVLPCHAAETIPGLVFWSVRDHNLADIWDHSPAFRAFRGTDWMREPCRSCDRREIDFGGCRCQALAIAGDASATDPACELSPLHHLMASLAEESSTAGDVAYAYRGRPVRPPALVSTPA
jgi:PqqA peptide cyclase